MIVELTAKQDKKCEGLKFNHYTFGSPKTTINGGFYIEKGQEVPSQIVIEIKKGAEDES